jgi:hypothetical protein
LRWFPRPLQDETRRRFRYAQTTVDNTLLPFFASGFGSLSVQNKNCRRGPDVAATFPPSPLSGAVSVPLPRTPSENILSNTFAKLKKKDQLTAVQMMGEEIRTSRDERLCRRLTAQMAQRQRWGYPL